MLFSVPSLWLQDPSPSLAAHLEFCAMQFSTGFQAVLFPSCPRARALVSQPPGKTLLALFLPQCTSGPLPRAWQFFLASALASYSPGRGTCLTTSPFMLSSPGQAVTRHCLVPPTDDDKALFLRSSNHIDPAAVCRQAPPTNTHPPLTATSARHRLPPQTSSCHPPTRRILSLLLSQIEASLISKLCLKPTTSPLNHTELLSPGSLTELNHSSPWTLVPSQVK